MSHNDTWDPKPEAGREYMGERYSVSQALPWFGKRELRADAVVVNADFGHAMTRLVPARLRRRYHRHWQRRCGR